MNIAELRDKVILDNQAAKECKLLGLTFTLTSTQLELYKEWVVWHQTWITGHYGCMFKDSQEFYTKLRTAYQACQDAKIPGFKEPIHLRVP